MSSTLSLPGRGRDRVLSSMVATPAWRHQWESGPCSYVEYTIYFWVTKQPASLHSWIWGKRRRTDNVFCNLCNLCFFSFYSVCCYFLAWLVNRRVEIFHPLQTRQKCFSSAQDITNMVWFGVLVFNRIFSTNKLYHAIGVYNIYCAVQHTTNQTEKYTQTIYSTWALWVNSSPRKGVIREVFLASHLARSDN